MGNLQRTQKCSELAEKTKHRSHSPIGDQIAQFSSHLAGFWKKGVIEEVREGFITYCGHTAVFVLRCASAQVINPYFVV